MSKECYECGQYHIPEYNQEDKFIGYYRHVCFYSNKVHGHLVQLINNNNIMTKTEIKKALYKQKPIAVAIESGEHTKCYEAKLNISSPEERPVFFDVPKFEAQGFGDRMPGQLLIRWMR